VSRGPAIKSSGSGAPCVEWSEICQTPKCKAMGDGENSFSLDV
jgi:hypothetical protein